MKQEIKFVRDLPMSGTFRDAMRRRSRIPCICLRTQGVYREMVDPLVTGPQSRGNNVMSYIYTSTTAYHRP